MRGKLFVLTLILASVFVFYSPAQAKDTKNADRAAVEYNIGLNARADVRYVRLRGKRYKVWYRTFRRNGRRYVRVYRIQRA